MFDLFSDIFSSRENALTRVDARAKLGIALLGLLAVLLSTRPVLPLAALVLCLAGGLLLGLPLPLLVFRLLAPAGIVLVLLLVQAFTTGSTPLCSFSVGGCELTATREGAWRGLVMAARVLGAVSIVLLLGVVTPAHRLFQALRSLGLSAAWVEIAMLMYRYTFVFLEQAEEVATAQKLRLGYDGLRRSLASLGVLAGTVVLRSVDQAQHTHEAMTLRGYSGQIPFGPTPALSGRDWRLLGASSAALLLAYLLLEGGLK
ncbi:MAG: cobalt ECF transporter T component CbiQ [Planctomycetes bacterium]|nr:cobalt ECF transporter T component CbiQ [Planctomycetota bacterium]